MRDYVKKDRMDKFMFIHLKAKNRTLNYHKTLFCFKFNLKI